MRLAHQTPLLRGQKNTPLENEFELRSLGESRVICSYRLSTTAPVVTAPRADYIEVATRGGRHFIGQKRTRRGSERSREKTSLQNGEHQLDSRAVCIQSGND